MELFEFELNCDSGKCIKRRNYCRCIMLSKCDDPTQRSKESGARDDRVPPASAADSADRSGRRRSVFQNPRTARTRIVRSAGSALTKRGRNVTWERLTPVLLVEMQHSPLHARQSDRSDPAVCRHSCSSFAYSGRSD